MKPGRWLHEAALYAFHLLFARPVLKWLVGVRYRRRGLLPPGPCLVVSNHNSHLDAPVLMSMFPARRLRHIHPVAAIDYFGESWLKRTMALLFMNGLPFQRRPRSGQDPLAPLAEALGDGKTLIFFPEGSRGEAGVIAPFRPGVGRLAQMVPGLLVVPVFLSGPERIWPRGRVVPVPFDIDVYVGRPRSYDPAREAREIAEEVQRDVVALAPPLPPQPGPRPAPPLRVAVCGLDAHSRAEVFRRLTARLGHLGRTLGVGEVLLESDAAGVHETSPPVAMATGRAWIAVLARLLRAGGRFREERFVEMVDRAKLEEALGLGAGARFVVSDGSALLDPVARVLAAAKQPLDEAELWRLLQYLGGEKRIPLRAWWRYLRRAPQVWLVNVLDLASPPLPDVLVNLAAPAADEASANLQEAYRQIGRLLKRRQRVVDLEVDPAAFDPEAIVAVAAAS